MNFIIIKRHRVFLSLIFMTFLGLIFYIFLYNPLIEDINKNRKLCDTYLDKLSFLSSTVVFQGNIGEAKQPISEENITWAMGKISQYGKIKRVDILSIGTREMESAKGVPGKVAPIDIKVVSTYEDFAVFLGGLKDIDKIILTVRSLKINLIDKDPQNRIQANIVLDLYIKG